MQGKLPLEQEDSTASLPDAEQTKGTLSYTTPDSVQQDRPSQDQPLCRYPGEALNHTSTSVGCIQRSVSNLATQILHPSLVLLHRAGLL